jgi:hypothetical protein
MMDNTKIKQIECIYREDEERISDEAAKLNSDETIYPSV